MYIVLGAFRKPKNPLRLYNAPRGYADIFALNSFHDARYPLITLINVEHLKFKIAQVLPLYLCTVSHVQRSLVEKINF